MAHMSDHNYAKQVSTLQIQKYAPFIVFFSFVFQEKDPSMDESVGEEAVTEEVTVEEGTMDEATVEEAAVEEVAMEEVSMELATVDADMEQSEVR